ncbi:hypothetical protein [Thaumasiovibrio subtropicus]|uniref:hypothetical protein n=1 Tax=Thaumasiovibrio subtropicus TaxID=1891207 RepID=UPI000B36085E|nr:hypothetical protein [Thaumasiovibrio subtropicus]
MTKTYFIAALIAASISTNAFAFADLYSGTLSVENEQLILTRCSSGSPQYRLIDQNGDTDTLIANLPEEIHNIEIKTQARVFGKYVTQPGVNSLSNEALHLLEVDRIEGVKVNASCHLQDLFG